MNLQPREQSLVGIGAIAGVLIIGYFYGFDPQWKIFSDVKSQLTTANATSQSNEATIAGLNSQKQEIGSKVINRPPDKEVPKINIQEGKTLESLKIELLSNLLELAQKKEGNTLIYVKPLPLPPPPPEPVNTDPNAPQEPQMRLSDFIQELPYELAIRGNYTSINNLINELAAYEKVIEVTRLEIIPESKTGGTFKDPSRPLKAVLQINFLVEKG